MSQSFPETTLFACHLQASLSHCIVNPGLNPQCGHSFGSDLPQGDFRTLWIGPHQTGGRLDLNVEKCMTHLLPAIDVFEQAR
jgi:hypothetical protein